jgi:hypothetical protein
MLFRLASNLKPFCLHPHGCWHHRDGGTMPGSVLMVWHVPYCPLHLHPLVRSGTKHFSHASWPCVHLLWRNLDPSPLLPFKLGWFVVVLIVFSLGGVLSLLGFELRALCLLSRSFTTWVTPPPPMLSIKFSMYSGCYSFVRNIFPFHALPSYFVDNVFWYLRH